MLNEFIAVENAEWVSADQGSILRVLYARRMLPRWLTPYTLSQTITDDHCAAICNVARYGAAASIETASGAQHRLELANSAEDFASG